MGIMVVTSGGGGGGAWGEITGTLSDQTDLQAALDAKANFVLNNYSGSGAPGVNDDSSAGYAVDSKWYDTAASPIEAYLCLDATVGAAVWGQITIDGDDLGSMAFQNANLVTITGGSVTGITDIAVADGGTGASDAATARTNLGIPDQIEQYVTAPVDEGSTGIKGQRAYSSNYVYECVATDTWVRTAVESAW